MLCPTGVLRLLRLQNLVAVCFPPALNLPFSSLPWGLDRSQSTLWLAGRWTDTRMGQRQSLGHCPLSHCSVEPWIPSRVCEDSVTGIPGSRDRNPSIPCRPHRCCSRCRERRSSLRSRRVCVPTRRGWAGSFPPGSAAFPRCRCSSPAPPRSRCWARSSGPCSGDRRAGTARGTGGKKVGRREG